MKANNPAPTTTRLIPNNSERLKLEATLGRRSDCFADRPAWRAVLLPRELIDAQHDSMLSKRFNPQGR